MDALQFSVPVAHSRKLALGTAVGTGVAVGMGVAVAHRGAGGVVSFWEAMAPKLEEKFTMV